MMKRSPLIFFATIAAVALAAAVVWLWGTRPEPTFMLFIGGGLAFCAGAARRRNPTSELPEANSFGVSRS